MELLRKRLPTELASFGNPLFTEEEIKHIRMVVPLCQQHHGVMNAKSERDAPYHETVYRKYFTELILTGYDGVSYFTKEEMALRGDVECITI